MRFRVTLDGPVPSAAAGEFLAGLAFVSEALERWAFADGGTSTVVFDVKPGREAEAGLIATRCAEVAESLSRVRRFPEKRLIERKASRPLFGADPHPLLEARGDLVRYGAGRYGLGPDAVALIEYFDGELRALASRLGASPIQVPTVIGADALARCRYFRSFPQSVTLVTHLREDLEAIRRFAAGAAWTGESLACDTGDLAPVTCLLSPAVCFHWYAALERQVIDGVRAVTAVGKCFRWEAANLDGLRRLWDFTMREVVFVGGGEAVQAKRELAIDECARLLDRWELEYDIASANDPFFVDTLAHQSAFQLISDLKFEARASLPYAGARLAVGSFNYHGDFFGRSFDITQAGRQAAHSACVAFGLERLFLAFVAQHGVDAGAWPPAVRHGVEGCGRGRPGSARPAVESTRDARPE